MNANAKEWHPPVAVASTSSCLDRNTKDNTAKYNNDGGSKTTANHKTRRRRQHQRSSQYRYGKKNVGHCQNGDISSTSNNTAINTNKVCHNDNSTHTSRVDDMISSSIQDVHQSISTQNHTISKHQEHQKQKQRRWRRRHGGSDKNTDNRSVSRTSDVVDGGGGSHHTQKVANHRRRHYKKKVNGSSTSEKQHPDDDELRLDNECNFPTLNNKGTISSVSVGNDGTNWNDSLANKLASIELEEQQKQKYLEEQLQLQEDMKESVQLTKLTYNKPLHNILDDEEIDGDDQLEDRTETDDTSKHPTSSSTETSTHNSSSNYQTSIPNTKHKWTNSELTKMRKRWWDAVRLKRKKVEEERLEKRRRIDEEKERGKALSNSGNGSGNGSMDKVQHDYTDDSSSDDGSSSSSSSSSDSDSLINTSYDPMEPPSLTSTPFDEMVISNTNYKPRPSTPPIIPYIKPTVSQSILDLEKRCLGLDYPLHYVIYNISLNNMNNEIMGNGSFNDNEKDDERNKSDGEVVLNRLLTMQSNEDVGQWKSLRVGLSMLRELDDEEESTLETDLLSADVNAMTPLQLAIYLNLPGIVRLLYTSSKSSAPSHSSKNSWDEEDEHGRTPLMLACELNHVECIQTIMCISSPRKLVRREQLGGNTAFHFCCMDRQHQYKQEGEEDSHDHHQLAIPASSTSQCASAFDMLLRYTPIKEQKRILSTTNYSKQNILHLACNQGDLQLLEILLDCHTTPGVNVMKALYVKDKFGHTPFVSAVASESTDIIMHFLSTRFAINPNLWLDGCALVVAVSSRSVEMVKLLLDSCYGSSPPGGQVRSEVNRALLETVYEYGEEKDNTNRFHQDDTTYEIIELLITEGGANPHLPSMIQFTGYMRSSNEYDGEIQEETPLTAAVRAGDPVAVPCMMNSYTASLYEAKQERRRDPMLVQQPESYFRLLEEKEDDIIHSSIDAALVASLFLLRYTGNLDYGKCGLVLYEFSISRTLSQQGLQWLEKCILSGRLTPTLPQGSTSDLDDSFEIALIRYHIPSCTGEKKSKSINDTCSSDTYMDWSYVLATLSWFKTRMNGVNCNWLKRVMLDPKLQEVDYQGAVIDDEFDLVVEGGVKLCAHRSIVSAKCGKLAAQIRFTECNSSESSEDGRLTVHVDLPQLVAKMLLSHIYHGSIVFGLRGSPGEQCQQLLELALLAEEYLCPSLLLECELRLLERSSCTLCICPQCSGGKQISMDHVSSTDQVVHRTELKCLEKKARDNLDESLSMFCKPTGVHIYKSSIVSSNSKSIITAQNGLNILAVAQQLEHSSQFNQQSLYHLKYNWPSTSTINGSSMSSLSNQFDHISLRGGSNKDGVTTQSTEKISIMEKDNDDTKYVSVPFAAAKSMSVRSMLCNFPVVLKSDSYTRQCKSNSYQEEEDMDEIDASFSISQADKNENGVLLLLACLEEL